MTEDDPSKLSALLGFDLALDGDEDEEEQHTIALSDNSWSAWRHVALRGAGFPATMVLALAIPEVAAAADQALQADQAAAALHTSLLESVQSMLDAYFAVRDTTEQPYPGELMQLRRQLRYRKPLTLGIDPTLDQQIGALHAAQASAAAAHTAFRERFDVAQTQQSETIRSLLQDQRFCEAIIWQNRQMIERVIPGLLNAEPGTSGKRHQHRNEAVIASYLQRYCVKNDTIGFFGPVGWASLVDRGPAISVAPGQDLLAARSVYFEGWAIDALATALARSKQLQPWLAPRRMPFIAVDGLTLHQPLEGSSQLSAQQATVLQACDERRTAQELAADLLRTPAYGFTSASEVYRVLEGLQARGLIAWTLEVPVEARPERTLRRLLDRVGDQQLRSAALAALSELEAARVAVAQAAGDARQLAQQLTALDMTFTRLTGLPPTRAAGQTYAARTLVYEDCRRDATAEIGPAVLDALAAPLALLLESARWFTYEAAAAHRAAFKALHAELAQASGSSSVAASTFWLHAQSILFGEGQHPVDTVVPRFQERWSAILDIPADTRRVAYTSAQLRSQVQTAFAAPQPGWMAARYHSPDVMIAAPSTEAIERGDFLLVLGELHIAHNTLGSSSFIAQCPFAPELFEALNLDMPAPRLVPITPRNWHLATARTRPALVASRDLRLVFAPDSCGVPPSRAVPISALVIEPDGDQLVARSHDGRLRFEIIEVFASLLSDLVANCFNMVPKQPYIPRLTIDRLVVRRETWNIMPDALPFVAAKSEAERFIEARRWARQHSMPRWVFVKVPGETKPFYLDWDSPIYVEMFIKMVRRVPSGSANQPLVSISEMLPQIDQAWLPDAQGRHYTSELRLVAVDTLA